MLPLSAFNLTKVLVPADYWMVVEMEEMGEARQEPSHHAWLPLGLVSVVTAHSPPTSSHMLICKRKNRLI